MFYVQVFSEFLPTLRHNGRWIGKQKLPLVKSGSMALSESWSVKQRTHLENHLSFHLQLYSQPNSRLNKASLFVSVYGNKKKSCITWKSKWPSECHFEVLYKLCLNYSICTTKYSTHHCTFRLPDIWKMKHGHFVLWNLYSQHLNILYREINKTMLIKYLNWSTSPPNNFQ